MTSLQEYHDLLKEQNRLLRLKRAESRLRRGRSLMINSIRPSSPERMPRATRRMLETRLVNLKPILKYLKKHGKGYDYKTLADYREWIEQSLDSQWSCRLSLKHREARTYNKYLRQLKL